MRAPAGPDLEIAPPLPIYLQISMRHNGGIESHKHEILREKSAHTKRPVPIVPPGSVSIDHEEDDERKYQWQSFANADFSTSSSAPEA
jgi:hypothetical protein